MRSQSILNAVLGISTFINALSNSSAFKKYEYGHFGWVVHQINSLYEILKLKQNFQKIK